MSGAVSKPQAKAPINVRRSITESPRPRVAAIAGSIALTALACVSNRALRNGGKQRPLSRDSFERMRAETLEPNSRARDQILDRMRDQDLGGLGQCRYPGRSMHCDTTDVIADKLAFPGVKAGPYLDCKRVNGIGDALRTAYRPRRPVEPGQNAIAGRADLDPAILPKLPAHPPVEPLQEIPPALVAHRRGPVGRAHDIGEKNRRQDAIRFSHMALPGEKFLNLVEDRFGISRPGQMVRAGEFDELRLWNPLGHVTARAHVGRQVAGCVQDQRWHPNRGQNVPDVDLVIHARQGRGSARARTHAQESRPPLTG